MNLPAAVSATGILLQVGLTPKSSAARIAVMEPTNGKPLLKADVTAPPEDGKANEALAILIAGWLGVPKTKMTIASGHKSRLKSVAVSGESADLMKKLAVLLAAPSGIPAKKAKGANDG